MTERPDINAVIEHYGGTTKDRRSYMTACPICDSGHRTPCFSVNTERNLFKCQSCGQGGDSFNLIMRMEDCDFRRAAEIAAAQYGAEASAGDGGGNLPGGTRGRRSARRSAASRGTRYRPRYRQ